MRRRGGGGAVRQRGSATVLTAGGVAATVVVLAAALLVVGVVHDVHRARSAADLAALAGAAPLVEGGSADCSGARSVAAANGARLTSCGPGADGSVRVTVAVGLRPVVHRLGWRDAVASARAGVVDVNGRTPSREPPP